MPVLAPVPDLALSAGGFVTDAWTVQQLTYQASSFTFTATSASPAVFTATSLASPPSNGTAVQLFGTSLPTGFSVATTYYVVNSTQTTFQLALTPGGTGVNSTSTGSGTAGVMVTGSPVGFA